MGESLSKLESVVDNLNEVIPEEYAWNLFSLHYSTYWSSIRFGEMILWDSDNDEREYIEEKDDYEDLEQFVIKKFVSNVDSLLKLKELFQNA